MAFNDGLVSLATSIGQRAQARDFVAGKTLTDKTLANLYEHNWLVQKFVNVRTTDMTRIDRNVLTADFDNKSYESSARRTGFYKAREECLQWASLYGDAIIVAITDETDLAKPLDDFEKIKRFLCLDKTAYEVGELEDDITNASFGKPRMYKINGDILIHNSRLVRIEAGKRSFKDKISRKGKFGISDIQAIKDSLFNYLTVCANIFDIVEESKTDVLKIDGFNQGVASGREEDYQALAMAMASIKSSTSTLFLDATAMWEQKELTFAGLTDIWNQARTDLAGACNMPLTRLFGQSASGFASGSEDNQNYYESLASLQESRLRPIDEFGDKFLLADGVDFIYPSIEISNEVEKATVLGTVTTALTTLLMNGVIDEAMVAQELKDRDLVNIDDEYIEELKGLLSEETESYPSIEASGSVLPQANDPVGEVNARYGSF